MKINKMYQVSTLQALALGYARAVIDVGELLTHGNIGLGTFEDVDGEMILVDGECYRAAEDGSVVRASDETGVPFSAVAEMDPSACSTLEVGEMADIGALKQFLTLQIDEAFSLNSMHVCRIEGSFRKVVARSEAPYRSHHITLKEILSRTQKEFVFEDIEGTIAGVYFPDYMDGINAPGWHLHFISDDRRLGGHVFDMSMISGEASIQRLDSIEIRLPMDPAFDTYSLKESSMEEIKEVETGD